MLVGARFTFTGEDAGALFRSLPSVLICRADSEEASALRCSLEMFVKELRGGKPGSALSMEHLAQFMFIQMLRSYVASYEAIETGWWAALRDIQLSAALSAMHQDLAWPWTLDELARLATMSRSSFADKFKRVIGEPPLEYLTRWRMRAAAQLLRTTTETVIGVANSVGYTSESAFSTAFKKCWGQAPRNFRKAAC